MVSQALLWAWLLPAMVSTGLAAYDLHTRRIPNLATYSLLLFGLVLGFAFDTAREGLVAVSLCLLPGIGVFYLGIMGGGGCQTSRRAWRLANPAAGIVASSLQHSVRRRHGPRCIGYPLAPLNPQRCLSSGVAEGSGFWRPHLLCLLVCQHGWRGVALLGDLVGMRGARLGGLGNPVGGWQRG